MECQHMVCCPPEGRYRLPPLCRYAKAPQHPLNRLYNHLLETKVSFRCSLPIKKLFMCLDMYWLYLEPLTLHLLTLFWKRRPHHPFHWLKPYPAWRKKNSEILMGHLQTPYFLVSQTDFPPRPSQDNQFGNSMVFVPVGKLLSDNTGRVDKASINISFCTNSDPLLLSFWHLWLK